MEDFGLNTTLICTLPSYFHNNFELLMTHRCTSPVADIIFFLYVSTSYEILIEHWDGILQEYHTVFCNFLTELGSSPDIFPFSDFKAEFKINGLYGVVMGMEALPFQLMNDSDTADLDALQGVEASPLHEVLKPHIIHTAEGRLRLANVAKHAIDNGFV